MKLFCKISQVQKESLTLNKLDNMNYLTSGNLKIIVEEVNRLINKFDMEFLNMETDPREIWGMEIPVHVPTTYIIKNNLIVETLITPQTYESLVEAVNI